MAKWDWQNVWNDYNANKQKTNQLNMNIDSADTVQCA